MRVERVLVSALCLLVATPAVAIDGWVLKEDFTASVAELRKTEERAEVEDGIATLLQEIRVEVDADGRKVETWRRVFAVSTPAAVEGWGTIQVPYSPWYQERPDIQGRVIGPDGTQTRLDPSTVRDGGSSSSGGNLLNDGSEVQVALPALVPGSIVEQVIIKTDRDPFIQGGVSRTHALSEPSVLANLRIEVSAPKGVPFTWALGEDTPDTIDVDKLKVKGRQGLVIEREDVEAVEVIDKAETSAPYHVELINWSTWDSWESVGRAYSGLVEPEDPESVADWVAELEALPEAERVTAAISLVRDRVRYTGLEFGQRAIVAWPPSETRERGYGDCKDKAVLLSAVLNGLGMKSHLALIRTFPQSSLAPETPGLSRFDHAIVYVAEGPGAPMWIDATVEHARPGVVSNRLQGRRALVIEEGVGVLRQVPYALDGVDRWERRYEIPAEGDVVVSEHHSGEGTFDSSLRDYIAYTDPKELQEGWDRWLEETWRGEGEVELIKNDPRDLSVPYTFEVKLGEVSAMTSDGRQASIPLEPNNTLGDLPGFMLMEPDEDDPLADREEPLLLWPFKTRDSYLVRWNELLAVDRLPEEASIQRGPLAFEIVIERVDETSVRVRHNLSVTAREVPVADAIAFREDLGDVLDGAHELQLLDPAFQLLRQGKWVDAYRHYDGQDALSARSNRIDIIRSMGMVDLALAEAEKLVAEMPEEPRTWRLLADTALSHKSGRHQYLPVVDHPRAIEALKKLKTLEEDESWGWLLVQQIAIDAQGNWPTEENAPEALALLDEWESDEKKITAESCTSRAQLYAALGRWDDIMDIPTQGTNSLALETHRVASVAMSKGMRGAAAEARREVPDPGQRAGVFAGAVILLINQGEYELAGEMADASAEFNGDPRRAREYAELVKGIRPMQEAIDAVEDPAGRVALEAMVYALDDGSGRTLAQRMEPIVAKRLRKDAVAWSAYDEDEDSTTQQAPGGFRQQAVVDMTASSMKVDTIDGDAEGGWRVKIGTSMAKVMNQSEVFLVAQGGKPKMRAFGGPSDVGAEALWRLDKGDTEGAMRWLGWAAETARRERASGPHSRHPGLVLFEAGEDESRRRTAALLFAGDRARKQVLDLDDSGFEPLERAAIARARFNMHREKDEWAQALAAIEVAATLFPDQPDYAWYEALALGELERIDDLKKRAESWRGTAAWSPMVEREVVRLLVKHRPEEGVVAARELIGRGGGGRWLHNHLAWHGPRGGMSATEALRFAEKAAEAKDTNPETYNTLAVLQLLAGRPDEAIVTMRATVERFGGGSIDSEAWLLVEGGVAAAIGREADAREIMKGVDPEVTDELWFVEKLIAAGKDPDFCAERCN